MRSEERGRVQEGETEVKMYCMIEEFKKSLSKPR